MSGGTEAFPDLGRHCQLADCHQLDFLPFTCQGCQKVFCLEHRTCKSHQCPKSDDKSRMVVVCEICGSSIEVTGKNAVEAKTVVEKHEKSGDCDPKKKKKPTCPVGRCKETLIFSNTSVCKTCHLKVCLKHRFPADHACNTQNPAASISTAGGRNQNFLLAFASRNVKDCAKNGQHQRTSSPTTSASTSVKAY